MFWSAKSCGKGMVLLGAAALNLQLGLSSAQVCANLGDFNDLVNVTCPNACSGHGVCDTDTALCACTDGWGSESDVADYKAPDCSLRVCPSGPSWGFLANERNFTERPVVECSNMGVCDRSEGRCKCAAGHLGSNCGRRVCAGGCNGRGVCISMEGLAVVDEEVPLDQQFEYSSTNTSAWDATMIYGCVCDSESWTVGTGADEYQVSEFFGPHCEYKRCPSGDDPLTDEDETDCEGVNGGAAGNLCYVPCANRGNCNERTGTCECYKGYTGENCEFKGFF
eukprot:INCI7457.1.p1 GENE.INCI7457.1~~INCI7457.1.p1  ORF type:complete len:280 (-),score=41.20 INCI7457.1:45-884(-)